MPQVTISFTIGTPNTVRQYLRPGQGDGYVTDVQPTIREGAVLELPFMVGHGAARHEAIRVQVSVSPADLALARGHLATLSPLEALAKKAHEEEAELDEAVRAYRCSQDRHQMNACWSHLLSEAADVVNTTVAAILNVPPLEALLMDEDEPVEGDPYEYWGLLNPADRPDHYEEMVVWATAFSVAIHIVKATVWADAGNGEFRISGDVPWAAQRLLEDIQPVARAVVLAAIAKTAEVAVRPHRRLDQ